MKNCPICNQPLNNEYECNYLWCDDCTKSWESFLEFGNTKFGDIAEWAANRAREFEKKKAEVLIDSLEEVMDMRHGSDYRYDCEGYCHVEVAQEALEKYRNEKEKK